jgi:hypothetical protein
MVFDPLTPVPIETMQQAIALTEWFLNEAHRVYEMLHEKFLAEDDAETNSETVDKVARIIILIIKKCGGEARIKKFRESSNHIHKVMNAKELKQKLDEMVKLGVLTVRYERRKGRDVAYYSILNASGNS